MYKLIKKIILPILMFTASIAVAYEQDFNISIRLRSPISITVIQELLFPDVVLSGTDFNLIVQSTDVNAASFISSGGKNRTITTSIVPPTIYLTAPGILGSIKVDSFTVFGPSAFDSVGNASFKVGATASILASSEDADYSGFAIFRVVYQ